MKDSIKDSRRTSPTIPDPCLEDIQEEQLTINRFRESLFKILQTWPNEFESDLLKQYKWFSFFSEKGFSAYRSMRHQLRIICSHYLMRKNLLVRQKSLFNEIDLEFRLIPTLLEFPFGQKPVLGIAVCIYLPDFYKLFNDRHIVQAVKDIYPNIQAIKESFLIIKQQPHDPLHLIYLEIEKTDNSFFIPREISQLKQHFKYELKKYVENIDPTPFEFSDANMALPSSPLNDLYLLYLETKLEAFTKDKNVIFKTKTKKPFLFAILRFPHRSFEIQIKKILEKNELSNEFVGSLQFNDNEGHVRGYILSNDQKSEKFTQTIQKQLTTWIKKMQNVQVLRLSMQSLPLSLDPRFGGDILSWSILKMLFEGLTRIGKNEEPELAIAKSVAISKNGKKYTFKLRKSFWNNKDPVTAHDFCYSWKKILTPSFKSPFVYFFYVIKNAKLAKAGKVSHEEIGIKAIDDFTLEVELEHPYPFFLKCVSSPVFSPVNQRIDAIQPNWSLQKGPSYVSNGPFQLIDSKHAETYELTKNPYYWDQKKIKLDQIQVITQISPRKALEMYDQGELDWLGYPFRPWVPVFSKNPKKPLEKSRHTFTHWYIFNVNRFPFQSTKIRQALSLAVNRQTLLSLIPHSAIPAFSPIPLCHTQFYAKLTGITLDPDVPRAKELFQEGLKELGITRDSFPTITFYCNYNEIREKIAESILQQWKEIFGIDVKIEYLHFKDVFKKITNDDFQLAGFVWTPLLDDPYYTLNVFKYSEDQINLSNWENKKYKNLIDKSYQTSDEKKRNSFLLEAERILIREVPIMPILHEFGLYRKQEHITERSPNKLYDINYKQISANQNK